MSDIFRDLFGGGQDEITDEQQQHIQNLLNEDIGKKRFVNIEGQDIMKHMEVSGAGAERGADLYTSEVSTTDTAEYDPTNPQHRSGSGNLSDLNVESWSNLSNKEKFEALSHTFKRGERGGIQIESDNPDIGRIEIGRSDDSPLNIDVYGNKAPEYWISHKGTGGKVVETSKEAYDSAMFSHGERMKRIQSLSNEDLMNPDLVRETWLGNADVSTGEIGQAKSLLAAAPEKKGISDKVINWLKGI